MKRYSEADTQRLFAEGPKGSQLAPGEAEHRSTFARDRARVLHSAALRRLADKTQVVGPRDGDTPRTRLTHSLEVAQIARGIGAGLGLDPDLCELAGLCHDIGHPPYGHNGENALHELADTCGGFEGNAQTLRILARLEPKVLGPDGESYGLNLTRASLNATCKYPWSQTTGRRKYNAYAEDEEILAWVRQGATDERAAIEAQVMDWSDDVAYSVHDVEDGILAGRIDLGVLWDLVELAAMAEKGARAFGGDPERLIEAANRLRQLPVVAAAADFDNSFAALVSLKSMTSELVGRFVGAPIAATLGEGATSATTLGEGDRTGATRGAEAAGEVTTLRIPDEAAAEVQLLKTAAVLYVMDDPKHLASQDRQRDRIYRVYDYLAFGAPGALDPTFAQWFQQADSDAARQRVLIDQIASMTESRLERLAREAASFSGFFG